MTRGIVFADVRLGFDDHPRGNTGRRPVNQHHPEQVVRHLQRRSIVELARENASAPPPRTAY